ncbi:MAG: hypothetical protein L0Y71_17610 [Gemmataceae bacterium]|nr:hypothetical protein [Gemmataceae bacterium]
MNRTPWRRAGLLAALILPALVVLGAALDAQAQPRFERIWRCSKCGGNLGNGVQAPPSCPHCGVRLIGGRDNSWYGPRQTRKPSSGDKQNSSPIATAAVIVVVILAAVGLGVLVMNSGTSAS